MSGHGINNSKKNEAPKQPKITIKKRAYRSRSKRAGLVLPVAGIDKILREGNYSRRIGISSSIYLAAVLEYLTAQILELAAKAAAENGKARITPRYIMMAIKYDDELDLMLKGVIIAGAGVLPNIQKELLPKMTAKRKEETPEEEAGPSQEH